MPNEADIDTVTAELEGPNPPTIADAVKKSAYLAGYNYVYNLLE
jgi:hypothetical protein